MKIFKSFKFKPSSIILVVLLLTLITSITYANINKSVMKNAGEKVKLMLANIDDSAVAKVNGKAISKKSVEMYKIFYSDRQLSDNQVLDNLIDREVIYQEALRYTPASDDEVDRMISNTKNAFKADDEAYQKFKDYLDGAGMNENDYWKNSRPLYKKYLTCSKYKSFIAEKYKKEKNIVNINSSNRNDFEDYYLNYTKELKNQTKIEYLQ